MAKDRFEPDMDPGVGPLDDELPEVCTASCDACAQKVATFIIDGGAFRLCSSCWEAAYGPE